VKVAEVAVAVAAPEPLSETGPEPTGVPWAQGAGDDVGPHSVKVTVPVGAPPVVLPVTVAVSATGWPSRIDPVPDVLPDCWVAVVEEAGSTVKHWCGLCWRISAGSLGSVRWCVYRRRRRKIVAGCRAS